MDETNDARDSPATPPALPAGFAARFEHGVLDEHRSTLVAIGVQGEILWFNRAWRRFAHANGGADVLDRFGVGAIYFEGIAGQLRDVIRDMFADSLHAGRVVEMEYECSSAEVRRTMRLRALPIPGAGLLLEHSCIRQRAHVSEASDALYLDGEGIIVQCSNCRRVRQSEAGQWDWVPDWVKQPHPATSHGICEVCLGFYYKTGSRRRRGRRG
jgi:hypothetical protein